MKVLKTFTRIYVSDLDTVLPFCEGLYGVKTELRFTYPEMNLELASVGDLLFIAGSPEALKPFEGTKATFVVDSLDEFLTHLNKIGVKVIREPKQVPTGKNMTVQHPDGTIIEYVEHTQAYIES